MASTREPNDSLDYGALLQVIQLIPEEGVVKSGCVVRSTDSLKDAARTAWAKARAYDKEHRIPDAASVRFPQDQH